MARFIPFVLIVALAAFVRLWHLDLIEFKGDEAMALARTAEFVVDGKLPTVGLMSSVGVYNPPLFIYLLAAPFAAGRDPLWITAIVALTNIVAVMLAYVLAARAFGRRAAIVAGLAFAVAPWAVIYSRKIWAQDLLPIFAVALLWALHAVSARPRSAAVAAVPVLLCALWQLHLSAYAAAAVSLLSLVISPGLQRISWRWLGIGVLLAAALAGPYVFDLAAHDFADVRKTVRLVKGDKADRPDPSPPAEVFREAAQVAGGTRFSYLLGASNQAFKNERRGASGAGVAGACAAWAMMGIGVLYLLARAGRMLRPRPGFPFLRYEGDVMPALVLLWAAAPPLVYLAARLHVYPHYYIIGFPAPFLLIGAGAEGLFAFGEILKRRFKQPVYVLAALAVAAVVAGQLFFLHGLFSFLEKNGGAKGDYGIVYGQKAAAAQFIVGRTPAGARPALELDHFFGGYEMQYLVTAALEERDAALRREGKRTPARPAFAVYDGYWNEPPADLKCGAREDFGPIAVCAR
jgi:4-amino-4-deoxy-L-arabinose transferase-like glycosyltransferase